MPARQMPCYRLTLAYDGTLFAGSQMQPNRRTVQGELQRAVGSVAGEEVTATFAGRTDRGVHAVGQVAAVGLGGWSGTADELRRAVQARLPGDLAVTALDRCGEGFNPRFDARWREYRYWVSPGPANPFLGRFAWLPRGEVDVSAMAAAAQAFVGTHDFASFASGGEGVPWAARAQRRRGTTRSVYCCDCRGVQLGSSPGIAEMRLVVEVRIVADGYLPRMVRNIVGALVAIGQGKRGPLWIPQMIAARDRRLGPPMSAPPQGLTFWRVGFGSDPWEAW